MLPQPREREKKKKNEMNISPPPVDRLQNYLKIFFFL